MSMIKNQLLSLHRFRPMIHELVIRDLKVKYRRSFLGYLWSLLNPLLMMLIMSLVFSRVLRIGVANFPLYLICGQTLFNFFSESTSMAQQSILSNAALIKKIYIPKYIFPVTRALSSFVNMSFSLSAIVLVMIFTGARVYWTILLFFYPVFFLFVFSSGVGIALAAVTVYFRDCIYLWTVAIQAWMYMTPIFYTVDMLPDGIMGVVTHNPLYYFITFFRSVVMDGAVPDAGIWIGCAVSAAVSLLLGLVVFRKLQKNFILYI